jgi:adenylate cyclase
MNKKLKFDLLIPLIVSALLFALSNVNFYNSLVFKVNDLLLALKPAVTEDQRILFLDIDDGTLEKTGSWPISRRYMAEGLNLLKEFGAQYAVFDIEYVDPRPYQINEKELYQGIEQVVAASQDKINELRTNTDQVFKNNDLALGQAARLFENAFFTIRYFKESEVDGSRKLDQALQTYALDKIALRNLDVKTDTVPSVYDVQYAIRPILQGGKGAGYVNSHVDVDGVLRRIDLIVKYEDKYLPQLIFAPLLDLLGQPKVIIDRHKIILEGVKLPDTQAPEAGQETENDEAAHIIPGTKDIVIPLDPDNKLVINWNKKAFAKSFRHQSFWLLPLHREQEKRLLANLAVMQDKGYLYTTPEGTGLIEMYHTIEDILSDMLARGLYQASDGNWVSTNEVDEVQIQEYRDAREIFFEEVKALLAGPTETEILQEIDSYLASGKLKEQEKQFYLGARATLPKEFAQTREVFAELTKTREILKKEIPGSFCLIGLTSTSTTDIGVTPFEEEFMNVGLHANTLNTILGGHFLDTVPTWLVTLLATLLALILTFAIRNLRPILTILTGLIFLLLLTAASILLLMSTGLFFNLLTPFLTVFLTFFFLSLLKFMLIEKEKSFLRNAFSYYLSSEVINELLVDPSKLQLGGDKRDLTAIFTDIKGFSTISEQLDPTDLVKLLNHYLTEMSNIILELKGTIDKYEGDAIMAFFGAPIPMEDHARRTCLSAIRMKKIEKHLNEHLLQLKHTPTPLLTRIGINTGEMVVGNMGTQKKMDYTVMGHAVNLASRLEGANKQYGTWILMSENTYLECGYDFFVRMLDRVRVIGIQNPVRLYELIDEKSLATPQQKEGIDVFHAGLQEFEKRDWDKAEALFKDTLKILPEDGPANILWKRCQKYKLEPPPENWDNVFNLGVK